MGAANQITRKNLRIALWASIDEKLAHNIYKKVLVLRIVEETRTQQKQDALIDMCFLKKIDSDLANLLKGAIGLDDNGVYL